MKHRWLFVHFAFDLPLRNKQIESSRNRYPQETISYFLSLMHSASILRKRGNYKTVSTFRRTNRGLRRSERIDHYVVPTLLYVAILILKPQSSCWVGQTLWAIACRHHIRPPTNLRSILDCLAFPTSGFHANRFVASGPLSERRREN